MPTQMLLPDVLLAHAGWTGTPVIGTIDEDPDDTMVGGDWLDPVTASGSGSSSPTARVGFPTPTGNPSGVQTFKARLGLSDSLGVSPTARIDLYEAGVLKASGPSGRRSASLDSVNWDIVTYTAAIPVPTLVSQSRTRISRVVTYNSTDVVWSSDLAFTDYQFRAAAAGTDPVTSGVQLELNQNPAGGGAAGTQYTSTLTDAEIEAVSPAEGAKVVKLFLNSSSGWSS